MNRTDAEALAALLAERYGGQADVRVDKDGGFTASIHPYGNDRSLYFSVGPGHSAVLAAILGAFPAQVTGPTVPVSARE